MYCINYDCNKNFGLLNFCWATENFIRKKISMHTGYIAYYE